MKIEFIVPTFQRTEHLAVLLGSLVCQTSPNWTAHVIADCPDDDTFKRIKAVVDFYYDNRIRLSKTNFRHNDWGHTPRNIGLQEAQQEWIVMTGEDNYYMPRFVADFLDVAKSDPSIFFVFCNFVNIYRTVNNVYYPVKAKLELGFIDIGCFMFKNLLRYDLKLDTKLMEADYKFAQEYLIQNEGNGNIVQLDKMLYVHN